MLYEKTGAKANSDSPVLRALAALETEGSHRDLTDYDPWRARPYAPAVTAARNAGSLVLRLRELCFQHGVPASALKRIAAAAAAEVAVTGFADAQKLWADSEHFKRASAGAVRLPDPRPFAVP
jgi:hypothetical protein